jgi:hypothetical protein
MSLCNRHSPTCIAYAIASGRPSNGDLKSGGSLTSLESQDQAWRYWQSMDHLASATTVNLI